MTRPYAITGSGVKVEAASRYHQPLPEANERHVWCFFAVFRVQNPARERHDFDMENLLTVEGPGCLTCEQQWRPDIGSRCPGELEETSGG